MINQHAADPLSTAHSGTATGHSPLPLEDSIRRVLDPPPRRMRARLFANPTLTVLVRRPGAQEHAAARETFARHNLTKRRMRSSAAQRGRGDHCALVTLKIN